MTRQERAQRVAEKLGLHGVYLHDMQQYLAYAPDSGTAKVWNHLLDLEEEVERLRKALKEIAYHGMHSGVISCPQDYSFYIDPMHRMARSALDLSKPDQTE